MKNAHKHDDTACALCNKAISDHEPIYAQRCEHGDALFAHKACHENALKVEGGMQ